MLTWTLVPCPSSPVPRVDDFCVLSADAGRVTKAMQQERKQNALIDTDGDGVIEAEEIAALSANLDKRTVSVLDVPTFILEK